MVTTVLGSLNCRCYWNNRSWSFMSCVTCVRRAGVEAKKNYSAVIFNSRAVQATVPGMLASADKVRNVGATIYSKTRRHMPHISNMLRHCWEHQMSQKVFMPLLHAVWQPLVWPWSGNRRHNLLLVFCTVFPNCWAFESAILLHYFVLHLYLCYWLFLCHILSRHVSLLRHIICLFLAVLLI
jgi:hypothetical protein